jgi:hypothetical protein
MNNYASTFAVEEEATVKIQLCEIKNYVQTCNGQKLMCNCTSFYYLISGTSRMFAFHHIYHQRNLNIYVVGIICKATSSQGFSLHDAVKCQLFIAPVIDK